MGNNNGKIKRSLIFGSGTLHKTFLKNINKGDYIIGVDRGAYWLLTNNVVPDLAIGDFDSVTKKEFLVIKKSVKKIEKFAKEKDATDMELALSRAKGETHIFGGSGTRLDHTVSTLLGLNNQLFIDDNNRIRKITKGRTILQFGGYRYVSIIPITNSILLKLTGFTYNLPKTKLYRGSSRGVSNEIKGRQAVIEVFSGIAWVIESND